MSLPASPGAVARAGAGGSPGDGVQACSPVDLAPSDLRLGDWCPFLLPVSAFGRELSVLGLPCYCAPATLGFPGAHLERSPLVGHMQLTADLGG